MEVVEIEIVYLLKRNKKYKFQDIVQTNLFQFLLEHFNLFIFLSYCLQALKCECNQKDFS